MKIHTNNQNNKFLFCMHQLHDDHEDDAHNGVFPSQSLKKAYTVGCQGSI